MKQLAFFKVHHADNLATVQLMHGDLAAIPAENATDILVMSAFPGDYTALPGSLVLELEKKGLSVAALANDKEVDLLANLHCWLSKPLSKEQQEQFHFKKLLCFEPGASIKTPAEVVGDIFRCINSFAFDEDNNEIAMPMIGTGYQQVSIQKMLPALLDASYFWLNNGLPLKNIQLVVHSEKDVQPAIDVFNAFSKKIPQPARKNNFNKDIKLAAAPPPAAPAQRYDYFLSYAHVHAKDIEYFVTALKKKNNKLRIFYDKESIPPGGLWIQQISNAIQQADKVLIFLSPDYDSSPVCWDEFQCAKLVEYNTKKPVIQTLYLYGHKETPMPLIMGIYSYLDCREGDTTKLEQSITQLSIPG